MHVLRVAARVIVLLAVAGAVFGAAYSLGLVVS
jgi:hypothetical protein